MTSSFSQLPRGAHNIKPYHVDIADSEIEDLKTLLSASKVADSTYESLQEDGKYGVTSEWIKEAKEYWLNQFDW